MFHPVSGKHAISKVIAVLHLPQEVLLVNDLFSNLNKSDLIVGKYQKRGTTLTKTIQIDNNHVKVSNEATPNGFILEEFNHEGLTKNVLKLENVSGANRAQLTFECNEYDRWNGFVERLFIDVSEVNEHSKLYIEAISLTYLDEFEWDWASQEEFNLDLLFKFENDRSLEKLKSTHNGGVTNYMQSKFDTEAGQSEEKIEIFTNKDINRVSIVHTCAQRFAEVKLFDSEKLKINFNEIHTNNKNVLTELLTDQILNEIGIKTS